MRFSVTIDWNASIIVKYGGDFLAGPKIERSRNGINKLAGNFRFDLLNQLNPIPTKGQLDLE